MTNIEKENLIKKLESTKILLTNEVNVSQMYMVNRTIDQCVAIIRQHNEGIITSQTRNPTPNKMLDWQANFKDYEGGAVIGYGETPELATEDLLEQNRCYTCGDIHYPAPVPLDCKQGN